MVRNIERGIQAVSVTGGQQMLLRTVPNLERLIDEAIGAKPEAIDLVVSQMQIVDSAGLNWLLQTQRRLEALGIALRLLEPSAIMADVLLATRLESRFTVLGAAREEQAGQAIPSGAGGDHAGS